MVEEHEPNILFGDGDGHLRESMLRIVEVLTILLQSYPTNLYQLIPTLPIQSNSEVLRSQKTTAYGLLRWRWHFPELGSEIISDLSLSLSRNHHRPCRFRVR